MATERLAMHQAREIIRQKLTLKRTHREVMAAVGVSMGTVSAVMSRALALGLDWEGIEALDDEELDVPQRPSQNKRTRHALCRTRRRCTWSCGGRA